MGDSEFYRLFGNTEAFFTLFIAVKLILQHIKKQFHNTPVLEDITFTISDGEFVSVIGSSGAGKTTLFRILNGELRPDAGQAYFGDTDLFTCSGRQKRKLQQQVGTIYQDYRLVEQADCLQNVLNAALPEMHFPAALVGAFGKERRDEAADLLEQVGLGDKLRDPVRDLSGGQKQRCAIARALMRHPSVILADEPVSSLDPVTGRQILGLLRKLQEEKEFTVLMNSHNLAMSRECSDRIIGIRDGRMVYDGAGEMIDDVALNGIYEGSHEIPK